MADAFGKPPKLDHDPVKQDHPIDSEPINIPPELVSPDEIAALESRAVIAIEEYTKSVVFMEFVEGLLRDRAWIEVEVDPEDDPEVWRAMQDIFKNPSPKLNSGSYYQVIDAVNEINKIEAEASDPGTDLEKEFLDSIPVAQLDAIEEEIAAISAEEIEDEIDAELESRLTPQTIEITNPNDPPPPPPPPPRPSLWRWRRLRLRQLTTLKRELRRSRREEILLRFRSSDSASRIAEVRRHYEDRLRRK